MEFVSRLMIRMQNLVASDSTIEAVERVATKGAYAASGMTVYSGLTINEWGVIVGMLLGAATFGFNAWFKMKYGRGKKDE